MYAHAEAHTVTTLAHMMLWAAPSSASECRQRTRQAFQAIVGGRQALMQQSVLARQQGEEREAAEAGRHEAQRKQARCD